MTSAIRMMWPDDSGVVALLDKPHLSYGWWRIVAPYRRLRQYGIAARVAWEGGSVPEISENEIAVLVRLTAGKGSDHDAKRERAIRWIDQVREQARCVVYECDDDVFTSGFVDHMERSDWLASDTVEDVHREREATTAMMRACDGVTCASEALSETVRGLTERPVITVPNAIDVRVFTSQLAVETQWSEVVTIGWAGGRRPDRDVEPMAEAWGRIARRYPYVYFVVAGFLPDAIFRHVENIDRVIRLPWQPIDSYAMGYQVDIGCCAVADTPFSRMKTPIKAWEYTLAGAAVVATPALYGACVKDEWTGLLATTADDWERALSRYLEDRPFRRDMRLALHREVVQHHALDNELYRWAVAYRDILEAAR